LLRLEKQCTHKSTVLLIEKNESESEDEALAKVIAEGI